MYIVSNELSNSYLENKYFFDDKYSSLKKGDTLFYIETGYFKKKEEKLIVFLNFDSLTSGITLDKIELVFNKKSFSNATPIDKYKEDKVSVDDYILYSGGARLEFDLSSVSFLAKKELLLKVRFNNKKKIDSIEIKCNLDSEYIWPT